MIWELRPGKEHYDLLQEEIWETFWDFGVLCRQYLRVPKSSHVSRRQEFN